MESGAALGVLVLSICRTVSVNMAMPVPFPSRVVLTSAAQLSGQSVVQEGQKRYQLLHAEEGQSI